MTLQKVTSRKRAMASHPSSSPEVHRYADIQLSVGEVDYFLIPCEEVVAYLTLMRSSSLAS